MESQRQDVRVTTLESRPAQAIDWLNNMLDRLLSREAGTYLDVRLHQRVIHVTFTPAAMTAAATLTDPLTVDMELYFSCYVRKAVRFRSALPASDSPAESHTHLHDQLYLQFSPVTTKHCALDTNNDEAPPLERMPVTRPQAFLPPWVSIDYRHGKWLGEFGY